MLNYLKKPSNAPRSPILGLKFEPIRSEKKAAPWPLIFKLPTKIQLLDNGSVTSNVNLFEVIQ